MFQFLRKILGIKPRTEEAIALEQKTEGILNGKSREYTPNSKKKTERRAANKVARHSRDLNFANAKR